MWKICLMVTLLVSVANANVLFSDSFDRPNNTNISDSTDGMGGTVGPLTYIEAFEGSGNPSSIQIDNNRLNIARGVGMSSLFVDYNFTDVVIVEKGGFSVAMDVVNIFNADDELNRFGGFGVGNTYDEALAAKDSFDSPVPFRPAVHRQGIGVSDFYVDLALDQNLRLWSNGTLLNAINVGVTSGTIKVDFLMSDFNAGSVVTAVVYFNDIQQDVQNFTWDHTDANYIGISGRTAADGVYLDNLSVAVIPEPATLLLLGLGAVVLRKKAK